MFINNIFLILQTLYDPSFIAVYNVIYTSLPIIAVAILDQVYTVMFSSEQ